MNEDVSGLIIKYCREMDALRELLRKMREHYGFLESVRFESLNDVLRFQIFLQMQLPNVRIFMCTGVPSCAECDHLRQGVWAYLPQLAGFPSRIMTVGTIVEFIRETDQCCEHEVVTQIFKSGETLHILIKDDRFGETPPATQTRRAAHNN
jgi:hypothetical protein